MIIHSNFHNGLVFLVGRNNHHHKAYEWLTGDRGATYSYTDPSPTQLFKRGIYFRIIYLTND